VRSHFDLPVWCLFNMAATAIPAHLVMHRVGWSHHLGSPSGAAYWASVAAACTLPLLVNLPLALFLARHDPEAEALAGLAVDGKGRPVPAWRRAARQLLARIARAQVREAGVGVSVPHCAVPVSLHAW
jgi:hypothetical protein